MTEKKKKRKKPGPKIRFNDKRHKQLREAQRAWYYRRLKDKWAKLEV